MSRRHFRSAIILAVVSMGSALAQAPQSKVISFDKFIRDVRKADAHKFLTKPGSKIRDAGSFEEMRQYILSFYRGVHVQHSYSAGPQIIDCVPINEQPSARAGGRKIASEPDSSAKLLPPQQAGCENGTIPIARITLEQLSHFNTLHDFLQKSPDSSEHVPQPSICTGHWRFGRGRSC